MTAGIETLKKLSQPGVYEELERKSNKLVDSVCDAAKIHGHDMCGGTAGGMFGWFFTEGPVILVRILNRTVNETMTARERPKGTIPPFVDNGEIVDSLLPSPTKY
jgi:glutamate-1-semialdehyde aminotransferase